MQFENNIRTKFLCHSCGFYTQFHTVFKDMTEYKAMQKLCVRFCFKLHKHPSFFTTLLYVIIREQSSDDNYDCKLWVKFDKFELLIMIVINVLLRISGSLLSINAVSHSSALRNR